MASIGTVDVNIVSCATGNIISHKAASKVHPPPPEAHRSTSRAPHHGSSRSARCDRHRSWPACRLQDLSGTPVRWLARYKLSCGLHDDCSGSNGMPVMRLTAALVYCRIRHDHADNCNALCLDIADTLADTLELPLRHEGHMQKSRTCIKPEHALLTCLLATMPGPRPCLCDPRAFVQGRVLPRRTW